MTGEHRFPPTVIDRLSQAAKHRMKEPLTFSALEFVPDLPVGEGALAFMVRVDVPVPAWSCDPREMRLRCVWAIGSTLPEIRERMNALGACTAELLVNYGLPLREGPLPPEGEDRR